MSQTGCAFPRVLESQSGVVGEGTFVVGEVHNTTTSGVCRILIPEIQ
jgi:hypothetical protein